MSQDPVGDSRRWLVCGGVAAALGLLLPDVADAAAKKAAGTTPAIEVSGSGPVTFFAPHASETTCVAAARSVMRRYGGRLVRIAHRGGRNASFSLGGKRYAFDPNRIFSDQGAAASLRALGAYSDEALAVVRGFAARIVAAIGNPSMLVALHNNSHYSMANYGSGGEYAGEAAQVSRGSLAMSPHDFFFVTAQDLYQRLTAKGFNVAMQRSGAGDDGSMSVFWAGRGAYVNVEAAHGHLAEQTKMLQALFG